MTTPQPILAARAALAAAAATYHAAVDAAFAGLLPVAHVAAAVVDGVAALDATGSMGDGLTFFWRGTSSALPLTPGDPGSGVVEATGPTLTLTPIPVDPATSGTGTPDGEYPITLTATDAAGRTSTAAVTLTVVGQAVTAAN